MRTSNLQCSVLSVASIRAQLDVLRQQLADLRNRRQQQELEIANIENYALRKRFQDILDKLLVEQLQKEQEVSQPMLHSDMMVMQSQKHIRLMTLPL
jgi:glycoprotein-N-acetylgalactosamine 3-beta-galactosyltransferase/transcription initiation factor TFIID subunit 7